MRKVVKHFKANKQTLNANKLGQKKKLTKYSKTIKTHSSAK